MLNASGRASGCGTRHPPNRRNVSSAASGFERARSRRDPPLQGRAHLVGEMATKLAGVRHVDALLPALRPVVDVRRPKIALEARPGFLVVLDDDLVTHRQPPGDWWSR